MGCTGSKYQALSAEHAAGTAEDVGAVARPGGKTAAEGDAVVTTPNSKPGGPSTPPGGTTPATPPVGTTPGSPGSNEPLEGAVGPPPWGPGSRNQSAMPGFEPPLAESNGDDDVMDAEMIAAENLEERLPPWKEGIDKIRPACGNSWKPGNQTPPAGATPPPDSAETVCAESLPTQQVWEPITTFENTVIIFDWDDTLLCSSALHCCLPNQFVELEETVEGILQLAMSLGRTIIVTNAMESWIQETTRRFMPRLMPTLERLLIVYARKNWERLWPGDTFAWKREAFRELLNDKLGSDLNLLVIGDSLSEIRAAEALQQSLGSSALVKTVKFKALPTPNDLLGELRTIAPELSRMVEEKCCISKELFQDVPTSNVFQAMGLQGVSQWQLLDAVPCEMFTPRQGTRALLWSQVGPVSTVGGIPVRAGPPPTQITI